VCVPECPVNAIYADDEVPDDQKQFVALNAELAKAWPTITDTKDPLPEAEANKDVKGKFKDLKR
jgi:ferredoxin